MSESWHNLEENILKLAHAKWGVVAHPETINGVNHDCVLKFKPDYWVIIETTQERNLDKLRGDVNRLQLSKQFLMSINIYSECYFVCEQLSSISSLRTSGQGMNLHVMSLNEFAAELYDYDLYINNRINRNFGSDKNRDSVKYVPVKYESEINNKKYTINDFLTSLTTGRNVILLGDFGTGKSRCIRELFNILTEKSVTKNRYYPLAINLRDVWGARTYEDIVSIHLRDLGVSSIIDTTFRLTEENTLIFLLDGFDEIGTQSWGADNSEVKAAKMASLAGVRDIARKKKKGIFIVGREHYFDNDEEMFECLGLSSHLTTVCRCQDEFSDDEISAYLSQTEISIDYPKWLPKKPLLCEYINTLGPEKIDTLLQDSKGEPEFWSHFIDKITERDSEISTSLSAGSIKKVLIELARMTRFKADQMEPFSVAEIKLAFQKCIGRGATSESEIMLQRLPGLGRFDSQSDERKFVDRYLVNGLIAEDLVRIIQNTDVKCFEEDWISEISYNSAKYTAHFVRDKQQNLYSLLKKKKESKNTILFGDLLHVLLYCKDTYDFNNLTISNTCFSCVDLSHKTIHNLIIENSFFEELNILKTTSDNFIINNCEINKIIGISNKDAAPVWIKSNINFCSELNTKKSIRKQEELNLYQRHFLEIIQKLFFQSGVSRSEKAMFKHKTSDDYKAINSILTYLNSEGIICISNRAGRDGNLYKPDRKYTTRMQAIKDELYHSNDPLWIKISKMTS